MKIKTHVRGGPKARALAFELAFSRTRPEKLGGLLKQQARNCLLFFLSAECAYALMRHGSCDAGVPP